MQGIPACAKCRAQQFVHDDTPPYGLLERYAQAGYHLKGYDRSIHRAIVALLSPVGLEVHALPYLLVVVSKPELTQRDTLVSVVEVDPFADLESGA